MIRGRQDPVPPDQINTSPDLILTFRLHWLGGRSAQDGTSASYYSHGGVTEKLFPSSSVALVYLDLTLLMINYIHGACLVLEYFF